MRALVEEKAGFAVAFMARMLEVSASGYYAWLSRPPSARELRSARLAEAVGKIHADSDGVYGSPRVLAELRDAGWEVSRKTVAKTMKSLEIEGLSPRSFVTTTVRNSNDSYPPDLVVRRWDRGRTDRVWVGDITYLRQGFGWIYLATVIDAHSKRVIGFATADHMRADLVQTALQMACNNRPGRTRNVIFHSDRGTQYASAQIAQFCHKNKIRRSMGDTGICWDNAMAESFFSVLKTEFTNRHAWLTDLEQRAAIEWWIDNVYNRRRRHSTISYKTPVEYEMLTAARRAAA